MDEKKLSEVPKTNQTTRAKTETDNPPPSFSSVPFARLPYFLKYSTTVSLIWIQQLDFSSGLKGCSKRITTGFGRLVLLQTLIFIRV